jgi:hypothetical protein
MYPGIVESTLGKTDTGPDRHEEEGVLRDRDEPGAMHGRRPLSRREEKETDERKGDLWGTTNHQ